MKLPKEPSFAWLCGFIGTLHTCIIILARGKADVNAKVDFTIPTSGWGTDSSVPSHPYYIDFPVEGLTADDILRVDVAPGSSAVAEAAKFTSTQTYAGKFRLRCKVIPTAPITAQYHITNTAEYSAE